MKCTKASLSVAHTALQNYSKILPGNLNCGWQVGLGTTESNRYTWGRKSPYWEQIPLWFPPPEVAPLSTRNIPHNKLKSWLNCSLTIWTRANQFTALSQGSLSEILKWRNDCPTVRGNTTNETTAIISTHNALNLVKPGCWWLHLRDPRGCLPFALCCPLLGKDNEK